MTQHIYIQYATDKALAPKAALLRRWAKAALSGQADAVEVTIRVVDIDEMTLLNTTYRHKSDPTNVLSFQSELPILGDIVICAAVVNREAKEQGKAVEAHWAHMVVHGIYHLLGYDHVVESEAERMEAMEVKLLRHLGYPDPYESGES